MKSFHKAISLALSLLGLILNAGVVKAGHFDELDLQQLGQVNVFTADIFQAHLHQKNEWMFAYHFEIMHMKSMAKGKNGLTSQQVLNQYMVTPTEMDMHMQMFHLMYAPSNDVTAMLMWQYLDNEMPHQTLSGEEFETQSGGIGDVVLGINYKFYEFDSAQNSHFWYSISSLSFPTGSIDRKGDTLAGSVVLPYPMQLGSGSYQMKLGLGYTSTGDDNAWGAITSFKAALNDNEQNYKVGEQFQLNVWYKKALRDNLSISFNGTYMQRDKFSGQDVRLNPLLVPTADASNQGFKRIDVTLGISWLVVKIGDYQHTVGFDYTKPIWQDVNGIQLQQSWNNSIYWQMNF